MLVRETKKLLIAGCVSHSLADQSDCTPDGDRNRLVPYLSPAINSEEGGSVRPKEWGCRPKSYPRREYYVIGYGANPFLFHSLIKR